MPYRTGNVTPLRRQTDPLPVDPAAALLDALDMTAHRDLLARIDRAGGDPNETAILAAVLDGVDAMVDGARRALNLTRDIADGAA